LKSAYNNDYVQTWRTCLTKAQFQGFRNFADAAQKLSGLDSSTSAILELFSFISINTGVAAPEIANAFHAPQQVVPPTNPDLQVFAQSNAAYIQALQGLENAVKGLNVNPNGPADPAAAQQVNQAAIAAENAAERLKDTFLPDPAGLSGVSLNRLEDPIESTKALISAAPVSAAGGAGKAFCAQIGPLLQKFPFNPQSPTEATTEEVAQIFGGQGTFAQLAANPAIRVVTVQQGSHFVVAPGFAGKVPVWLLKLLNDGQTISSALFPSGGNQPSLNFTLAEEKSPGSPDAVLTIDDKQVTGASQPVSFHWLSTPGSHFSISSGGNSSAPPPSAWSAFHFGFNATHVPPNRLKYSIQLNNQTTGVALFDVSGPGAPLLNPDFMRGFCSVRQ
jgi:type VI secretion system protein ImpL